MNNSLNFNIRKLFMSRKERQLDKLKKFLQLLATKTEYRLARFEITEGVYYPIDPMSRSLGKPVEIRTPMKGNALIYVSDKEEKYLCISESELEDLILLYKEALDM